MSNLVEAISGSLEGFGGHLECTVCGASRSLGNISVRLTKGWPKHCGYTMRWITNDELARTPKTTKGKG